MKYLSKSEKQTRKIAEKLAKKLKGGEVIALIGELGTGKTVFIKGLARALGIKKTITSPTFVLMKVYPLMKFNLKTFCHLDAYRIKNSRELVDIGALEYFGAKNTISVIEWADKVKKILPKNRVEIKLKFAKKENERTIDINSKKR